MRRRSCSSTDDGGHKDDTTEEFLRRLRKQAGFAKMQHVPAAPRLYIGAQICSRDARALQRAGVTHMLSMNGRSPLVARILTGMTLKVVDMDDAPEEDIASSFQECFTFIDEGRRAGGVLVFCTAGVSRSATIVIAYLMQLHRWTYSQAFRATRLARRWIKPNRGFVAQLEEFERQLLNASAQPTSAVRAAPTPECELCTLTRRTTWYCDSDPRFVVIECDACDCPMVVERAHGMAALDAALASDMEAALTRVANAVLGRGEWHLSKQQRTVMDHRHWHARAGPSVRARIAEYQARATSASARASSGDRCRDHGADGAGTTAGDAATTGSWRPKPAVACATVRPNSGDAPVNLKPRSRL